MLVIAAQTVTMCRGDLEVVVNFGDAPASVDVAGSVLHFGTGEGVRLDGTLSLPAHAGGLVGPA